MENVDIRYSVISDGEYIKKWLGDKETLRWYPMSNEEEIKQDVDNWIGFSKFKASLTAEIRGEVCGVGTLFLMPYRKIAHHCMFYMIVGKEYRGKDVGTSLFKNLLNLAENYFCFESVDCEIFEGSLMEKLLKKFNFKRYAYQKRYVKEENGNYLARILYQKFFEKKRFRVWRK